MNNVIEVPETGVSRSDCLAQSTNPFLPDDFDGTARLDMIDPTKGYVEGNVQWIHKDIQEMKGYLSSAEFLRRCFKVVYNQSKRYLSDDIKQADLQEVIKAGLLKILSLGPEENYEQCN